MYHRTKHTCIYVLKKKRIFFFYLSLRFRRKSRFSRPVVGHFVHLWSVSLKSKLTNNRNRYRPCHDVHRSTVAARLTRLRIVCRSARVLSTLIGRTGTGRVLSFRLTSRHVTSVLQSGTRMTSDVVSDEFLEPFSYRKISVSANLEDVVMVIKKKNNIDHVLTWILAYWYFLIFYEIKLWDEWEDSVKVTIFILWSKNDI